MQSQYFIIILQMNSLLFKDILVDVGRMVNLGFVNGILVELGKNMDLGIGCDHGSQPESRFHRLIRLIHEIKSNHKF